MKPIANTQTDHQNAKLAFRLIDIATYRGAFTAKKCIYNSNMIRYNNKYNNNALTRPEQSYKTRCPQTDRPTDRQTDRQTDIVTYRAAKNDNKE